jgi:hypothetical protein
VGMGEVEVGEGEVEVGEVGEVEVGEVRYYSQVCPIPNDISSKVVQ